MAKTGQHINIGKLDWATKTYKSDFFDLGDLTINISAHNLTLNFDPP